MTERKKLIEVGLPLDAISEASAREKSIRHGHPSTLHLWWARRPLAAARAVIFASLVDDPEAPHAPAEFVEACRTLVTPTKTNVNGNGDSPRMRLFDFIEQLVRWESTNDEAVLKTARHLIELSTDHAPPALLDPFAGGGSIPLEAQRLGLEAHASDLNPVAVMINKAQIEIPPRFANLPPIHPDASRVEDTPSKKKKATPSTDATWTGASGLAEDVRRYGEWMRQRAEERIGHLYPKYSPTPTLPQNEGGSSPTPAQRDGGGTSPLPSAKRGGKGSGDGGGETVIAWLWARTVKSPNPAVSIHVPLVRSFVLSKKKGHECWAKPVWGEGQPLTFEIVRGTPPPQYANGTVSRRGGVCLVTGEPIPFQYIRAEGKAGRMGAILMAVVTEGTRGRNYHAPDAFHIHQATLAQPAWKPDFNQPLNPRDFKTPNYGMTTFADLFTPRQLVALTTFSDLVAEAREQAYQDALKLGMGDDDRPLREGGSGARAYSEAISVYLAFAVDKATDYWSAICSWHAGRDVIRNTFGRQAIPMVWDYAECNPFSDSTGNWSAHYDWIVKVIQVLPAFQDGRVQQQDVMQLDRSNAIALSTDPPYYDNIGYADLSDFFYVWLRKSLQPVYPDLFSTLLVPKAPELVATPYRFDGSKERARQFFEEGMVQAFSNVRRFAHADYPLTVYYAFKQQESDAEADSDPLDEDAPAVVTEQHASSGWETMLNGLLQAGFSIVGTYPLRTEMSNRMLAMRAAGIKADGTKEEKSGRTNALASSIVLVLRVRPSDAPRASRGQFMASLREELPRALHELQRGSIAPVDLAQASIGPGMKVYSRYSEVREANGQVLTVRTALGLINNALDEYLAEQEGDLDVDTRFAVAWFERFGFAEGAFGEADVLARAKNASVEGVQRAGVVVAKGGKVRLIHWSEYDAGNVSGEAWDPRTDTRLTIWEATHHLIERLHHHGETASARLLEKLSGKVIDEARQLAYRLYNICERKGWAKEGRDYNALVVSWGGIGEESARLRSQYESGKSTEQMKMDLDKPPY